MIIAHKQFQLLGKGEILCAMMFKGGIKDDSNGDFKIGNYRCEVKDAKGRIMSNATNESGQTFFGKFDLYSNINSYVLEKIKKLDELKELKAKNVYSLNKTINLFEQFTTNVINEFKNKKNIMHFTTEKYPSLEMINSIFTSNAKIFENKFEKIFIDDMILKSVLLTNEDYTAILKNTLTTYFVESSNYEKDELNSIIELFFNNNNNNNINNNNNNNNYSNFLKNLLYFSIKYYLKCDNIEYIIFFNDNIDKVLILQKDKFKVDDINTLKILAAPKEGNSQTGAFSVTFNP